MNEWLDFSDFVDKTHDLIDLGLYDEAKTLLDEYAESFAGEWEYFFIYSRLYGEQNKPEQAIPYLRKGLSLDPTSVDCLVGLFYAYAMSGDIHTAGEFLRRAKTHHADSEQVASALIWYYAETNELDKAIQCFKEVKTRGTTNPETFRNAGIAYDRSGQTDLAIECYSVALELHPRYDEVRELLSDLHLAAGNPGKAIELYEQALKSSPNNIRYRSRLVFCLSQNNQVEKAVGTAEDTIKRYPNSPIGYVDLAYLRLNTGEHDMALAAAEKALDISPLDGEASRVKAIVYSEKEMDQEAEAAFEKALSLDPGNPETMRDFYHHYRETGNFEKMEALIYKVIEKEKSSCVEEYWFLADFYREQGKDLKALHFINKACKIRPADHELLPLIIDILIDNRHLSYAIRFMKKYVDQAGWNDIMNQFAGYPELSKKKIREDLQFLRFSGSKPLDYARYAFKKKLVEYSLYSLLVVLFFAAFPVCAAFGTRGVIVMLVCMVVALVTFVIIRIFRNVTLPHFQFPNKSI